MQTPQLTRTTLLVLAGLCFGWLTSAANHGYLPGSFPVYLTYEGFGTARMSDADVALRPSFE